MNWFKSFILGNIIWFGLTVVYGFIVGILNLDGNEFFLSNSFLHNFLLYPVGIWLGFKITKTPFLLDNKTNDQKIHNKESGGLDFNDLTKGEEEEIAKVKSNKSKNPIENNLVPKVTKTKPSFNF